MAPPFPPGIIYNIDRISAPSEDASTQATAFLTKGFLKGFCKNSYIKNSYVKIRHPPPPPPFCGHTLLPGIMIWTNLKLLNLSPQKFKAILAN